MKKYLTPANVAILIIIVWLAIDKLTMRSESQRIVVESEKKNKAAMQATQEALRNIETANARINRLDTALVQLSRLNAETLQFIQAREQAYNRQKDSTDKAFKNRLNAVKNQLNDLKKLQESL